jgi:prevent-host-death family protein
MITIDVHKAQQYLLQLLDRVALGEQFTITRAGKPVAVLSSLLPHRVPGNDIGVVVIKSTFDDPMPEFND